MRSRFNLMSSCFFTRAANVFQYGSDASVTPIRTVFEPLDPPAVAATIAPTAAMTTTAAAAIQVMRRRVHGIGLERCPSTGNVTGSRHHRRPEPDPIWTAQAA